LKFDVGVEIEIKVLMCFLSVYATERVKKPNLETQTKLNC